MTKMKRPGWSYLMHLGYNMWREEDAVKTREYNNASQTLRLDQEAWDLIIAELAAYGAETVVIDLGEGVQYESHPELAVAGSWPVDKLKKELALIRAKGLEPIPKLNFSATHDAWLGEYSRAVSTKRYYEVCANLIEEVCAIFDQPAFFHLGMDEETIGHQRNHLYAVIRHGDLWWHDLQFFIDQVEKQNVRAWVWSDKIWHHEEEFLKNMPRSVLQSNWYYDNLFDYNEAQANYIRAYSVLDEHGFDQVPTGSSWGTWENFPQLVQYCKKTINPARLLGFMQTPWKPTLMECRYLHLDTIQLLHRAQKEI